MDELVLIATRSANKLKEIVAILAGFPELKPLDLNDVALPFDSGEDSLEVFPTFAANALAKARYFAGRTGMLTLADDSGLCVDALGGAPGVRSKRFSGRADLDGERLDIANNELLLERMGDVAPGRRMAQYVCAAAIAKPNGIETVFEGTCAGEIVQAPVGRQGFGYDSLFYVPEEGATFGEIGADRKNELSHRARAIRRAASYLTRG